MEFIFQSSFNSIHAKGCVELLSEPVHLSFGIPNPCIIDQIEQAFERAKGRGVQKPILVGAVPFRSTSNSFLYIPEQYTHSFDGNAKENTENATFTYRGHGDKEAYMNQVSNALEEIATGSLSKAVLSRKRRILLTEPIDSQSVFRRLASQNTNSYNFLIKMGDISWVGASPELLVRKSQMVYESNPLAGSIVRGRTPEEDDINRELLVKSKKDGHEHDLVVRYICEKLGELGIEEPDIFPRGVCSTATMLHLSTNIRFKSNMVGLSSLEVAIHLHPTPAVCGYPASKANDLIARVESFDRGFFSGLVGWMTEDGQGEWVVCIRCAAIDERGVDIFAGAGIVKSSLPEQEFFETEAKMKTFINSIG